MFTKMTTSDQKHLRWAAHEGENTRRLSYWVYVSHFLLKISKTPDLVGKSQFSNLFIYKKKGSKQHVPKITQLNYLDICLLSIKKSVS